ncbi:Stomatal closure-related actin-binding protein 2 [Striga hermonthica]|uniref:Stomatal closure-related actin-binding protein 2 n=1 Tax=Striga hermonthica TaxID=68872 RepID=A0A9N7RNA9_STRHE|nr:Stomatal closure-related actin-binding protein 2 [Striga hermonthica]
MTRVSPEFGEVWPVSADVSFQTEKFPKYKLGPDNEILEEIKEDFKGPPLKEVVVQETNQLTEQHRRLSVRDLASKFDKNLAAAAKLSEEAKLKEVASLDGHVLLKKLRDALEYLKLRLAGRNREDVERAISMVEALAVKLTQKEGELIQEKFEVKKLVNFLKQVTDMENELRDLRVQIREKCTISLQLQNELAMSVQAEENVSRIYVLNGAENLGSILRIQTGSNEAVELGKCSIQWYRLSSQCSRREPILGANKCVYALEPIDVGRVLQADIVSNGLKITLTTNGPIRQDLDLENYLETLIRKSSNDFSVIISQMNGRNYSSHSSHLLHIGKTKIKLSRGWITKGRESYSKSMQLCGFRGGGNSAAKSLFWQSRKGQSFVLVFESERERNGALILARKYASDSNVLLVGPDDDALL